MLKIWTFWDTTGVVFRCDNEPSILALLKAVKLACTGEVLQETSADPSIQRRCRKFSKCRQRTCQIDQTGSGVSFECRSTSRPCSVDVACAVCSQHAPSVCGGSRRQDSIRTKCGKARCCSPWHGSVSECGGCLLQPSTRSLGPLDSPFEQGRYSGLDGWIEHGAWWHSKWSGEAPNNQTTAARRTTGLKACWTKHSAAN